MEKSHLPMTSDHHSLTIEAAIRFIEQRNTGLRDKNVELEQKFHHIFELERMVSSRHDRVSICVSIPHPFILG